MSEAGYRRKRERLFTDTHIRVAQHDTRRMDIVAAPGSRSGGAFHRVPLFCDVIICSELSGTGARRGSSRSNDGQIINQAARRKQQTHHDVVSSGIPHFLTLSTATYGRWHSDAINLVQQLAFHKSKDAPSIIRKSDQQGWSTRWWNILSVGVMRAVAEALLYERGLDLLLYAHEYNTVCLADVLNFD